MAEEMLVKLDAQIQNKTSFTPVHGLPKWPQMLTVGNRLTVEQAKEVIRRTDDFFSFPDASGNDETWRKKVMQRLRIPHIDFGQECGGRLAAWRLQDIWREKWGYIDTQYVKNSWIACSFIGGPHGWCNPDGNILFIDNIGKWPTDEEVMEDWDKLARAFPFIDLVAILMNGEEGEEQKQPIIGYRVANGEVKTFDPGLVEIPRVSRDFESSLLAGPVFSIEAERGIPWSWIEEWGKKADAMKDQIETGC